MSPTNNKPKQKRRKFSQQEKEALREGVGVWGAGNWAEIRSYRMLVLGKRTNRQLKDLFRTMKKHGEFPNVEMSDLTKKRRAAKSQAVIDDSVFFESSDNEEESEDENNDEPEPARKKRHTIPIDDSDDEEDSKPAAWDSAKQQRAISVDSDKGEEEDVSEEEESAPDQQKESNMVVIDDLDSKGDDNVAAPMAARSTPNNERDFVSAIDALFVQSLSNKHTVTVGDIQRQLEVQFDGFKCNKSMGTFIKNRLKDLCRGRIKPGEDKNENFSGTAKSDTDETLRDSSEATSRNKATAVGSDGSSKSGNVFRSSTSSANTLEGHASGSPGNDTKAETIISLLDDVNSDVNDLNSDEPKASLTALKNKPDVPSASATDQTRATFESKHRAERNDDDDMLKKDATIQDVNKVIQACESHIQVLQNDKSRTRDEIAQETSWWRQQVQKWETRLLSSIGGTGEEDETLHTDVNRFLSIMDSIEVFHSRIRELANDTLSSREEVAKRTMKWREKEQEWKDRLVEQQR